MKELNVISKLLNQRDVLEVEGDKLATKISVSNIETLTDAQLSELKVGDVVQKITGNQKHCYIVTYKQENHGICLSYFDAGYLETISYDYTDGHWVFNSKDVCEVASKDYVDYNKGIKLYKHTLHLVNESEDTFDLIIISIRPSSYTTLMEVSTNYEVLSYGEITPEDMPRQVVGIEDSGMDSFIVYYLSGGNIYDIEVKYNFTDTVTEL